MFVARCVLCGYSDTEHEGAGLVRHINEEHSGGLPKYLLFFGSIPLLSSRLQKAVEEYINTGRRDPTVKELDMLSVEDMQEIVKAAKRNMPERSHISVEEDF